MARGTRGGALFLWLACVGCGSSPPATPENGSAETGQTVPVAESDPGTPQPEGHAEVTPVDSSSPAPTGPGEAGDPEESGKVLPLEAPPSLPEPTCVPSPFAAPPVEAQACAISTRWADGRRQEAHYDSDGRLLELRTNDSMGALVSLETHVWRDGVELHRRVSYPGGRFTQTDWTYDGQRLVSRVDQGYRSVYSTEYKFLSTEYEYEDGLLYQSRTLDSQGAYVDGNEYRHDAQGRLIQIDSSRCDTVLFLCDGWSYWPNGRLRQHAWSVGYNWTSSEEYNEFGALIRSTWNSGSAGGESVTTRTYDGAGRLDRIQTRTSREFQAEDALTARVYTKGGWRERFAENMIHYPSVSYPDNPTYYTYRRITQRASFLCGTSSVALQEWDMNEDGIVDARRVHTRDEMGRRVQEQYAGFPGMDDGPQRREFHYDCH